MPTSCKPKIFLPRGLQLRSLALREVEAFVENITCNTLGLHEVGISIVSLRTDTAAEF